MDYCKFNTEEGAAAIMHKLGHIMNEPDDLSQKEFYADYYAHSFGFGIFLSKSLKKFLEKDLPFVDKLYLERDR